MAFINSGSGLLQETRKGRATCRIRRKRGGGGGVLSALPYSFHGSSTTLEERPRRLPPRLPRRHAIEPTLAREETTRLSDTRRSVRKQFTPTWGGRGGRWWVQVCAYLTSRSSAPPVWWTQSWVGAEEGAPGPQPGFALVASRAPSPPPITAPPLAWLPGPHVHRACNRDDGSLGRHTKRTPLGRRRRTNPVEQGTQAVRMPPGTNAVSKGCNPSLLCRGLSLAHGTPSTVHCPPQPLLPIIERSSTQETWPHGLRRGLPRTQEPRKNPVVGRPLWAENGLGDAHHRRGGHRPALASPSQRDTNASAMNNAQARATSADYPGPAGKVTLCPPPGPPPPRSAPAPVPSRHQGPLSRSARPVPCTLNKKRATIPTRARSHNSHAARPGCGSHCPAASPPPGPCAPGSGEGGP